MTKNVLKIVLICSVAVIFAACNGKSEKTEVEELTEMEKLVQDYAVVELSADLSHLSTNQKEIIGILIEVADIMDDIFWKSAFGDKDALMTELEGDEAAIQYALINYGPWDRLDANNPFIDGYGAKPMGANFYPDDITEEEFEAWDNPLKSNEYTLVRRDDDGNLMSVWYHQAYADEINKAAELLDKAAELAENPGFKNYLELRAIALRTDEYLASDLAWMDMKDNLIDFVVGPIEHYEDGFKGAKTAHSGQVLLKDIDWSQKLDKYNAYLPELQAGLPVPDEYKHEKPAESGDMNVYYVLYYAGDCNAAGKNIAINLPNDPRVHAAKGSRKLQLKNSMKAKFDKILMPIAELLIKEEYIKHIKFEDAFFQNVMFHEVAHGLGIKQTLTGKGSAREALSEYYMPIEEAKADVAALFMVTQLYEQGEFEGKDLLDNYVTFLAGIFRSTRFGAASAHGKANMMQFNYLRSKEAFSKDEESGKYTVNLELMKEAIAEMLNKIIVIQGDGDYEAAKQWVESDGVMSEELKADLDRVNEAGIPKDIIFKQGKDVLGL
jgi:hypothetical protein